MRKSSIREQTFICAYAKLKLADSIKNTARINLILSARKFINH
jgi:hypothetical protein